VAYYAGLFQKVRELPEWKEFMESGAFKDTFMKGQEFSDWLLKAEVEHLRLMREAGFVAK
jgi:putative tricarboxylic transport membrane protein